MGRGGVVARAGAGWVDIVEGVFIGRGGRGDGVQVDCGRRCIGEHDCLIADDFRDC